VKQKHNTILWSLQSTQKHYKKGLIDHENTCW